MDTSSSVATNRWRPPAFAIYGVTVNVPFMKG
jgi:hypothetical protein